MKEKSRFSVAGIAITTAIGLSMLVCGTMISNHTQGPAPQHSELYTTGTSLNLGELWMLSEKALEEQHYDDAIKYAQRAERITSTAAHTLPHAISLLESARAIYEKEMMDPEYEEARRLKNFAIAQESLRKSLSIFNEYLKGKNAVSEQQIIEALDSGKLRDLNRYYFAANGQLATLLADGDQGHSEEAKQLFTKVYRLFERRSERTNYPEQEAKRYLESLSNLYFADSDYLNAARVQASISEIWGERLVDRKSDPTEDASFAGTWVSPFKKSQSNMRMALKQAGDSVSGTISLEVLPTRAIWKGKIEGICAGNTSSTNFSISGIGSDNSSGESNSTAGKSTVQGELSLTRYKNYLVARLYNYSVTGSGDITLPYSEVLEIRPLKHAVSKK